MRNKLLIVTISAIFLTFLGATPVHAKIGLSVDPSLVKIQIKPGKAITKAFTVENTSDIEKQIVVRLIPFEKSDNLGNPIIDVKSNSPLLKYFSLSNTNIKFNEPFTIKQNSKEQIVLSIAIPENANIEDFYATLLFSTYENTLPADSKGTIISASIGANLLLTITSEVNPKTILKIDSIKITSPHLKIGRKIFSDSLTPLIYQLSTTNTGNHVTETRGTTSISKNDIVLAVQKILPQQVISKTSRQLLNADGNQNFSFKPSTLSFGWHSIKTNIKTENTNSNNSTDLFIFPFKISIGLFVSLLLLKSIVKFSKKKVDTDI